MTTSSQPPETPFPAVPAASTVEPTRRYSIVALAMLGLASFLIFIACMLWPDRGGFWGPGTTLAIAWFLFAVHLACAGRALAAFDPLIWIPVIMLLNYFGMPLALNVIGSGGMFAGYDAWNIGGPPRLTHGFAVALLSFSSLLLGMHLAGLVPLQRKPAPPDPDEPSIYGPALCILVGGTLMLLIGVPIAGLNLFTADYGELKTAEKFGTADLRFFGTGILFASAGVYAVIASHTRARLASTCLALVCAIPVLLILFLTGDRGGLSVFLFALGWVITQRVRSARRSYVIIGFVFALVLMPMIKEFRETRSIEEGPQHSLRTLAASTIYEMGMTLQVFCYSLEHIPEDKDYDWGIGIISQTINQIPNLGLSPGAYFGFNMLEHDPGQWVTHTANPVKYYHQQGGYGYAMGAEWYFNFGIPGVLLGMIFCGWVLTWARNSSRRSPLRLTFAALLIGMYVIFVRNDLGYPLRTMLWPMVGLLALRAMWPARRVSRTPASLPGRVAQRLGGPG